MKSIYTLFLIFSFASPTIHAEIVSARTVDKVITVDTTKAHQLFSQGTLFIDVRRDSDWNIGRIPDAIHIDIKDFSKEILLKTVLTNTPFVIYCNGQKCLRSAKAAALAVKWGFKTIFYYRDGFPAWKLANFPVE